MIIYDMRKPIESNSTYGVGVTGENLALTQEFYIKGISDNTISYSLHLRFADGSVNTVTPDLVIPDADGTNIRWIVKKNDIFVHGYFELQIEGRNSYGLIFQTEIVRLYADESIPVEDRSYENPNSETLRLREEAYAALEEITRQKEQIEANLALINSTSLSAKADKATTLSGYGITDAYTKTESIKRFGSTISVTFDSNKIPIKYSESSLLSAGNFATGDTNVTTVFVSSYVRRIQGGTFSGCTNLTDIYINNTEEWVTIDSGAVPDTVTVHYSDDFNAIDYIEQALVTIENQINSKADSSVVSELQDQISKKVNLVQLNDIASLESLLSNTDIDTLYFGTIMNNFTDIFGYPDVSKSLDFMMWLVQDYATKIRKRYLLMDDGTLWSFSTETSTLPIQMSYGKSTVDSLLTKKEFLSNKVMSSSDKFYYGSYPSIVYLNELYYKNSTVDELLNKKADKLSISVTFGSNKIPLKYSESSVLSSGNFATGDTNVTTVFVSSSVRRIQGGTFSGCTNLTDIYINNTEEWVTIDSGAVPDTVTVHYSDDFNAIDYIEQALVTIENQINSKADSSDLSALQEQVSENTEALANKIDDTEGSVTIQHINSSYLDDIPSDVSGPSADGNCLITSRGVYNAMLKKADSDLMIERSNIQLFKLKDVEMVVNGLSISIKNNHVHVSGSTTGVYSLIDIEASQITEFEQGKSYIASMQNIVNHIDNKILSLYLWGTYSADGLNTTYQVINASQSASSEMIINTDEARTPVFRWSIPEGEYDKEFDFMIEEGDTVTSFEPYYVVKNIANGSVNESKLSDDLCEKIDGKYDASNVEYGSGAMTLYSTEQPIDTVNYNYQKTGKMVTAAFAVTFTDGTLSYSQLTGLPYILKGIATYPNSILTIHGAMTSLICVYPVGSWLIIRAANSSGSMTVNSGQKLYFTITYEIA